MTREFLIYWSFPVHYQSKVERCQSISPGSKPFLALRLCPYCNFRIPDVCKSLCSTEMFIIVLELDWCGLWKVDVAALTGLLWWITCDDIVGMKISLTYWSLWTAFTLIHHWKNRRHCKVMCINKPILIFTVGFIISLTHISTVSMG